jgi:hypothetical protein
MKLDSRYMLLVAVVAGGFLGCPGGNPTYSRDVKANESVLLDQNYNAIGSLKTIRLNGPLGTIVNGFERQVHPGGNATTNYKYTVISPVQLVSFEASEAGLLTWSVITENPGVAVGCGGTF